MRTNLYNYQLPITNYSPLRAVPLTRHVVAISPTLGRGSYLFRAIGAIFKLAAVLPLSACVGSFVSGHSELVDGEYPDITEVPSKKEISKDRGYHGEKETEARTEDMAELELERLRATEEARELREQYLGAPGGQAQ